MDLEPRMEVLDRPDIQGLVVRAFPKLRQARYYLLQIKDADEFKKWLTVRLDRGDVVTAAARQGNFAMGVLNLAFTATGLKKLGVDPDPTVQGRDGFGLEFREGMADPSRSPFLGDVGDHDPNGWEWGGPNNEGIDCLCLTFAMHQDDIGQGSEPTIDVLWADLRPSGHAAREVHDPLDGYINKDQTEHFGFKDGISQPIIRFMKRDYEAHGADRALHLVEPGEFILGYENGHCRMPVSPSVTGARAEKHLRPLAKRSPSDYPKPFDNHRDFGRNGTYLVFRQIEQHVDCFRNFLKAARKDQNEQDALAARIVGRWKNGTPLVLSPTGERNPEEDQNTFGYFAEDRFGHRCPIGAHIRRGNPRDTTAAIDGQVHALERVNLHRLLRRGRIYGPPYDVDPNARRGLFFICLNADIRRQFEFVQQSWVNNIKFDGLSIEDDPLVGACDSFTIQKPEGHERLTGLGLGRFVTVKGGAYFFMPGIAALRYLAEP
jgi:Dyp-type peroxidase family